MVRHPVAVCVGSVDGLVGHLDDRVDAVAVVIGVAPVPEAVAVGVARALFAVEEAVGVGVGVEGVDDPIAVAVDALAVVGLDEVVDAVAIGVDARIARAEAVLDAVGEPVAVPIDARHAPVRVAPQRIARRAIERRDPAWGDEIAIDGAGVRRTAEDELELRVLVDPQAHQIRQVHRPVQEVVGGAAEVGGGEHHADVGRRGVGRHGDLGRIARIADGLLHRVLTQLDDVGVADAVDQRQQLVIVEIVVGVELHAPTEGA